MDRVAGLVSSPAPLVPAHASSGEEKHPWKGQDSAGATAARRSGEDAGGMDELASARQRIEKLRHDEWLGEDEWASPCHEHEAFNRSDSRGGGADDGGSDDGRAAFADGPWDGDDNFHDGNYHDDNREATMNPVMHLRRNMHQKPLVPRQVPRPFAHQGRGGLDDDDDDDDFPRRRTSMGVGYLGVAWPARDRATHDAAAAFERYLSARDGDVRRRNAAKREASRRRAEARQAMGRAKAAELFAFRAEEEARLARKAALAVTERQLAEAFAARQRQGLIDLKRLRAKQLAEGHPSHQRQRSAAAAAAAAAAKHPRPRGPSATGVAAKSRSRSRPASGARQKGSSTARTASTPRDRGAGAGAVGGALAALLRSDGRADDGAQGEFHLCSSRGSSDGGAAKDPADEGVRREEATTRMATRRRVDDDGSSSVDAATADTATEGGRTTEVHVPGGSLTSGASTIATVVTAAATTAGRATAPGAGQEEETQEAPSSPPQGPLPLVPLQPTPPLSKAGSEAGDFAHVEPPAQPVAIDLGAEVGGHEGGCVPELAEREASPHGRTTEDGPVAKTKKKKKKQCTQAQKQRWAGGAPQWDEAAQLHAAIRRTAELGSQMGSQRLRRGQGPGPEEAVAEAERGARSSVAASAGSEPRGSLRTTRRLFGAERAEELLVGRMDAMAAGLEDLARRVKGAAHGGARAGTAIEDHDDSRANFDCDYDGDDGEGGGDGGDGGGGGNGEGNTGEGSIPSGGGARRKKSKAKRGKPLPGFQRPTQSSSTGPKTAASPIAASRQRPGSVAAKGVKKVASGASRAAAAEAAATAAAARRGRVLNSSSVAPAKKAKPSKGASAAASGKGSGARARFEEYYANKYHGDVLASLAAAEAGEGEAALLGKASSTLAACLLRPSKPGLSCPEMTVPGAPLGWGDDPLGDPLGPADAVHRYQELDLNTHKTRQPAFRFGGGSGGGAGGAAAGGGSAACANPLSAAVDALQAGLSKHLRPALHEPPTSQPGGAPPLRLTAGGEAGPADVFAKSIALLAATTDLAKDTPLPHSGGPAVLEPVKPHALVEPKATPLALPPPTPLSSGAK